MNEPPVELKSLPSLKLKNKQGRNYQAINLKQAFGFSPEVIVIQKVANTNNRIIVSAVMPPSKKKDDGRQGLDKKEPSDKQSGGRPIQKGGE